MFNRDFMDYHQDRFEDFSLLVFKNKKLVAILPANKVGNQVYSHQGLSYGSFIINEKAKLLETIEAFKAALSFLKKNKIATLYFNIIPTFYNTMPSDELEYILFKANAKLTKKDALMVIDYKHKLKFQKNRREGINKAKRNDLKIKIEANFDAFWNEILIPNLARKHNVKPVHSLKEIKLLGSKFPNNIVQINVYKNEKIVAGTTLFLTKTTIHPQYVSGNTSKNNLGSLDLLYDFIINHYLKDKRYFDFNISSEKQGKLLNGGLIFWKESCGARTFVANSYSISTCAYKTLNIPLV